MARKRLKNFSLRECQTIIDKTMNKIFVWGGGILWFARSGELAWYGPVNDHL